MRGIKSVPLAALGFILLLNPVQLDADAVGIAVTPSAHPLSPPVCAKIRQLLPFPESSMNQKMELTLGLDYSLEKGFEMRRDSSDYAEQIVKLRRSLTGGSGDASTYRRLGNLYRRAGLPEKSAAAFRRSLGLSLASLRRRPGDGTALARYGATLADSGQAAAAESFLQNASRLAPRSAEVWMMLGQVSGSQASPKTEAKTHLMRLAMSAYDRAVSLAPENPAVWAKRGEFLTYTLPQFQGKLMSRDGLSDFQRAAALSADDPYAQAMAATVDCFTFEIAHSVFTSLKAARMEPPDANRRAKKVLQQISAIAQTHDRKKSAEAYTARAWVQFEFFYDAKGAQKSLRLALRRNPRQQEAVDYQLHVAAVVGDYPLVLAVCWRELRRHPEIRLRATLADAAYHLARWKEARQQLEAAHTVQPNDYALSLGLAMLLLKSGHPAEQPRAVFLLARIAAQTKARPADQQAEYDITRGICFALNGDPAKSKQSVQLALKNQPGNEAAKSVLETLPK